MARLMSSTELHQRIQNNDDFILIDVLSPEEFDKEHIPGAINIPLDKLSLQAKAQFNKNQRIVVYANAHDNTASNQAAILLEGMGFRKVSDFDGGIDAWKMAGFNTDNLQKPKD